MKIICCPQCEGKNILINVVEIWQKDRQFKVDDKGMLIEIKEEPPYFKYESYDSRELDCLDCKKTFPIHSIEDIEHQIDKLYG